MALAFGSIIAEVFFHLFPHAFLRLHDEQELQQVCVWILGGIILFFSIDVGFPVIQKMLNAQKHSHSHGTHNHSHHPRTTSAVSTDSTKLRRRRPSDGSAILDEVELVEEKKSSAVALVLISDLMHNFMDGVTISSAFAIDPQVWLWPPNFMTDFWI